MPKSPKKKSVKAPSIRGAKTVELMALPPLRVFGTNVPMAQGIEKGQITEILVEVGNKVHKILAGSEFVKGVHPSQGSFVLNAVIGGLGSGRGARQLGFATWVAELASQLAKIGFSKKAEEYQIVVTYEKRGGTMVYPLMDLIGMCVTKAKAARTSYQRFPREDAKPAPRTQKSISAEVLVSL
jgi:hypothetical protein